jgi:hypothetical protein
MHQSRRGDEDALLSYVSFPLGRPPVLAIKNQLIRVVLQLSLLSKEKKNSFLLEVVPNARSFATVFTGFRVRDS